MNGGGGVDFLKVSSEKKSPEKILFPKVTGPKKGRNISDQK